ncbi:MAG: hypothetical protein Q6373_000685 [Candidatus Sigynarchaeota archaeon]
MPITASERIFPCPSWKGRESLVKELKKKDQADSDKKMMEAIELDGFLVTNAIQTPSQPSFGASLMGLPVL